MSHEQDNPENCLHCVLSPLVQKFKDEHPEVPAGQIMGELLQLAGEFLASTAPDLEPHLDIAVAVLQDASRKAWRDFIAQGLRKPLGHVPVDQAERPPTDQEECETIIHLAQGAIFNAYTRPVALVMVWINPAGKHHMATNMPATAAHKLLTAATKRIETLPPSGHVNARPN